MLRRGAAGTGHGRSIGGEEDEFLPDGGGRALGTRKYAAKGRRTDRLAVPDGGSRPGAVPPGTGTEMSPR